MNKYIKSIYLKLPRTFQNILISLYGYRLKKIRFGGHFRERLSFLEESQFYSREEIKEYQNRELRKLIKYVYNNVPYYYEVMKENKLKPEDIKKQSDLKKLPILTKKDIIENYNKLQTTDMEIKSKDIISVSTSGSTGTPLQLKKTKQNRQQTYAQIWRQRRWFGVNPMDKLATFNGRMIVDPNKNDLPLWRKNYFFNQTLFSLYHLSDRNIANYVDYLSQEQFEYINGYPSTMSLLAKYINKNNINFNNKELKAIFTSSETLYDEQRRSIEKAFEVVVSDRYGNAECIGCLSQCSKGHYHLNAEDSILEVIDIEDNVGKVIGTNLNNYVMPLIRYEVGDMIELAEEEVECDINLPVYKKIIGREDDIIITPDGRYNGRLDHIFKGLKNIKRTQIIQEDINKLIIKLEVFDEFNKKDKQEIINNTKLRLGEEMNIDCKIVNKICNLENGKFRGVISKIDID